MLRVGRGLAATAVAALALLIGAGVANAEQIDDYDVTIDVQKNGDLVIEETIVWDFFPFSKHGILRNIPTRERYDNKYDRLFPLEVISVSASEGTPSQYTVGSIDNGKQVKIGDPDETIEGQHTYRIEYRTEGHINRFKSHDELYFDAIGVDWPVSISDANVQVTVPATIEKITCFTGPTGSNLPCQQADFTSDTATFSQPSLGPNNGLTVVVGFPKVIQPPPQPILDERWSLQRAFTLSVVSVGATALIALLAGGILTAILLRGRDQRYSGSAADMVFGSPEGQEEVAPVIDSQPIPVEFVPPDKLRPGQVGTLVDERANTLDVTATIIDLAVRGYLKIEEIEKEGRFAKADWKLTRLKESEEEGLLEYEQKLLDGLFQGRGDEVELSDLRQKFANRLAKVEEALYEDAMENGWFLGRPDSARVKAGCLGFVLFLVGVGILVPLMIWTEYALIAIPILIVGIVLFLFRGRLPRRTAKGYGVVRRVKGFREFIETSEKDRAQFAERAHLFSEYLPYAIVFGCTEQWAHAFEGLAAAEVDTSSWYVSSHPFTYMGFANTMDDFSVSTSGTISASPPSSSSSGSSGFSGGGSSGGGSGGGGGGSW
ncbi:MAG: DUF2207 domain-containing protein [Acidimicrobiia bacterium]